MRNGMDAFEEIGKPGKVLKSMGEPNQKMYMEALTLLGALGDNKLREDMYRSGQYKMEVA